MIREGTAARNLEALAPLLTPQYAERCMFCTDDKHPSDLLEKGHIDYIAREAINKYGVDPIIAVKAACHHASRYFLLNNRGAIAPGYLADFAVIDNFKDFNVEMVFKKGVLYWNNGELRDFEAPKIEEYLDKRAHDTFHVSTLTPDDFRDTRQRGVLGMVPGRDHHNRQRLCRSCRSGKGHSEDRRRRAPQGHASHRPRLHSGLRPEIRRGRDQHFA